MALRFAKTPSSPQQYQYLTSADPVLLFKSGLKDLSAKGDDLERLNAIVDFELFRPDLEHAVPRSDRVKGGRPPYDHVLMFRVLILQRAIRYRTSGRNI